MTNIRAIAAQCCFSVVDQGKSLSEVLPQAQQKISAKDHGLLQEICYGVLRYLPQLEFAIQQLMDKPLVKKQRPIHFLLLVGIYQLNFMRIPDHAAVAETVNGCKALKVNQLTKLVNAILRSYLRQKAELQEAAGSDAIKYCHPSWFIKKIQAAYPEQWQQILDANMQKPPMWLRVNQQKITVADYQQLLEQQGIKVATVNPHTQAICLAKPYDVTKLPNFAEGFVSVQDGAAQYAANLLAPKNDESILDCCAAPGGKTCHILEQAPQAKVTAIDIEGHRLQRVQENLTRLNLTAEVITADASDNSWHDGQLFDRILLDAPCSATGVIRRHPDIKWLRKANDINELAGLQQKILANMWRMLKPGGRLVYATCSVLPEENSEQITQFLANQADAKLVTIPFAEPKQIGWQILPDQQQMDGFYYAVLEKQP